MSLTKETQEHFGLDLHKMSVDDAKKLGHNYGAFIAGLRAEILNAGLSEEQVRDLLNDIVPLGDCETGNMCWTLTGG